MSMKMRKSAGGRGIETSLLSMSCLTLAAIVGLADHASALPGHASGGDACDAWPYECSQAEQTFYVTIDDGPDAVQHRV